MKKRFAVASFMCLMALGSCKNNQAAEAASDCIDQSKINPDAICTMQYEPVCGCDGKTYSNPCMADNAGVTSYTQGECSEKK